MGCLSQSRAGATHLQFAAGPLRHKDVFLNTHADTATYATASPFNREEKFAYQYQAQKHFMGSKFTVTNDFVYLSGGYHLDQGGWKIEKWPLGVQPVPLRRFHSPIQWSYGYARVWELSVTRWHWPWVSISANSNLKLSPSTDWGGGTHEPHDDLPSLASCHVITPLGMKPHELNCRITKGKLA